MQVFEFEPPKAQTKEKYVSSDNNKAFVGFGKNSKNKTATLSKDQKMEKEAKLKQFRDIIGKGDQAVDATLAANSLSIGNNDWAMEQAIKRAKNPVQPLIQVEITAKNQGPEEQAAQMRRERPATAKMRQQDFDIVQAKCMDFKPQKSQQQVNREQKSKRAQVANKPVRPASGKVINTFNAPYVSQNHFEGDYDKVKKNTFDDNLVLMGNQKPVRPNENTQQNRQLRITKSKKINDKYEFKAWPEPLKCTAATKFYRGHQQRKVELIAKETGSTVEAFTASVKWSKAEQQAKEENKQQQTKKVRPATAKSRKAPSRVSRDYKEVISERSRSRSRKRHEDMYGTSSAFDNHRKDDHAKRERTKAELSGLLKKYLGSEKGAKDQLRFGVKNAQHHLGVMHNAVDRANKEMAEACDELQQTRKSVRELETYKEIDQFNADIFTRDLTKGRIRFDNPKALKDKKIWTGEPYWEQY